MSDNSLEHNLDFLVLLSEALTQPSTLDDGLKRIVELTCQLMDTTQAAFLMADEDKQRFIVRAPIGLESAGLKDGSLLEVPYRLQDILWRLQSLHQINWIEAGIDGIHFPIITMPIYFKGRRIGHLITGGARDASKAKDPVRRKLYSLLGPFASLIIENAKATDLLSRRFALNSKELISEMHREAAQRKDASANPASQLLVTAVRNPTKVARLLAESFYRELNQAGFNAGQITLAAARIIDCIAHDGKPPAADEKKHA